MNIHNFNHELMDENILYELNIKFKKYEIKKYISFDQLITIVREYGYIPNKYELYDLKSEIGDKIDKIYFFVIMGRVFRKMKEKDTLQHLKDCFNTIDINKNGYIERDEFYHIVKKYMRNPPSYDHIIELFGSIDLNNDNLITFQEFSTFLQNY